MPHPGTRDTKAARAAFSQSLTNVRWRFLREDKHAQSRNLDMRLPLAAGAVSSRRNPRRRPRRSPRRSPRRGGGGGGSAVLSAGSEVLRQVPPAADRPDESPYPGRSSTLSQVRELQEALAQNDFPSKVFRYLSVGSAPGDWASSSAAPAPPGSDLGGGSAYGFGASMGMGGSTLGTGRSSLTSTSSAMGPPGSFSADDVQAEMDRLNAEFAKSAGLPPPAPESRVVSGSRAAVAAEAAESAAAASEAAASEAGLRAGDISASDSESDSDDEHRGINPDERPDSPIIIWRPSARVQIADDLPPELLAELE